MGNRSDTPGGGIKLSVEAFDGLLQDALPAYLYEVTISSPASFQCIQYIEDAEEVSEAESAKLYFSLLGAIRALAYAPKDYPFVEGENIPEGVFRKSVVNDRYLIVFQILHDDPGDRDYVFVNSVIDSRPAEE